MKIPILVSFAYYTDAIHRVLKANEDHLDILIDSGAYTAFTKGKQVDIGEYISFIKNLDLKQFKYFTLDAIGDAKKTYWNFKHLLNKGLNPIPIFTRGENLKKLDEYFKYNDLVALGGISIPNPNVNGYVKWIMDNGYKGRKVHWLGWSEKDFIFYYRPYSFDSTGWKWGKLYGDIAYLRANHRFYFRHQERAKGRKVPVQVKKLVNEVVDHPREIKEMANWQGENSIPHRANTLTYLRQAQFLLEKFNTRSYFAIVTKDEIGFLNFIYERYILGDKSIHCPY